MGLSQAGSRIRCASSRRRLGAGKAWQDNDLVFAASVCKPFDAANVRRITAQAVRAYLDGVTRERWNRRSGAARGVTGST